ncbi:hypothetical protein V8F20_001118 [Naviculisporaceae sp. PSN 640]
MADDVAEDYRQALEDLSMNSRLEISTLTNIARENADHGLAIAEVLQAHIKKVPPPRTLPALYVLDSIVKNVPTPYALYFGPKLYSIFMGAYTKVDNPTRRKMDEMLKTWKEPVPGSISTKPVFPPEFVRPIENALIGARNAALAAQHSSFQGQQQLLRRGPPPSAVPSRDTPTPPNMRPPFPGPNGHMDPGFPIRPHSATGRPVTQTPPTGAPYHVPQQQPDINIDKLRDDIQQLIVAERAEFARDPHDASKQTRLKALLDLQSVIQRPDVPREHLIAIKDQVAKLAVNMPMPHPAPVVHGQYPAAAPYGAGAGAGAVGATPTPPFMLPQQTPTPVPPPVAHAPAVSATPPATGLSIDGLLGQGALATLLSGLRNQNQGAGGVVQPPSASATPQPLPMPLPVPPVVATPPQVPPPAPAAPPPKDPAALLAMLRQSGLLPATTGASTATPPPPVVAPIPPPAPAPAAPPPPTGGISLASLGLGGLSSLLPQLQQKAATSTPTPPLPTATSTSTSGGPTNSIPPPTNPLSIILRRYTPHLLPRLSVELGSPCGQCGRRFSNDDAGRDLKAAHMDWHFRVHQRIAEAEKRGQHRSWYVGEMDWITGREDVDVDKPHGHGHGQSGSLDRNTGDDDDSDSEGSDNDIRGALRNARNKGGAGTGMGQKKKKKKKMADIVPVPDGAERVTLSMCPICQESFEMKWFDEEWVWMDAVKVGGRVYHASCHREAAAASSAGNGKAGGGRSTPDGGVLGKRKAEVCSFFFVCVSFDSALMEVCDVLTCVNFNRTNSLRLTEAK